MKFYYRFSFIFLLFLSVFAVSVLGQTISITSNFDTTIPYSPGSTIAVPFRIDNSTGSCITQSNTFNLYLSNSSGVYSSTPLATVSGFYATYINATIPVGTTVGNGYKVKITASSNPSATIVESGTFTIASGSAITAGIDEPGVTPLATGIFGKCDKTTSTYTFDFQSTSTTGTTGSVVFNNESNAATSTINALNGEFIAQQSNYTIIVKATNGTVYGTKAYTLINNSVNNNLGSSASTAGCLPSTGSSVAISYTINTTPLLNNFPGNTYRVNWGDGSASSTYTLCDIINAGNTISHTFTRSSCGNNAGAGNNNVFKVDIQPVSPYCSLIGTQSSSYASISLSPSNKISGPTAACSGVVKFTNASYPGEDPGSTPGSCIDFAGAKYNWYLDGSTIPVLTGVSLGTTYSPTLTHGQHVITLRLTNNQTSCTAADAVFVVCVQDPPKPKFTLPVTSTCTGSTVTPTDQTVLDNICPGTNTYTWTVTGPAAVTYSGGTNANSNQPQFVFNTSGTYLIKLAVSTPNCGSVETATQQIVVNTTPAVTLSANTSVCGTQTLTFNNTTGSNTRTIYTGTVVATSATYTWTVTVAGGIIPATFVNGTTANSQYPQINFPDYGDYTVTVTHTNNCGSSPVATQVISIKQAPTITATAAQNTVCQQTGSVALTGTITGSYNSFQWVGGNGTFTPNRTSFNPTYTPTAAEFAAGTVTLALQANTSLPAPCVSPSVPVTITLVPDATRTSAATASICSDATLNYNITTTAGSSATYSWTAALTSGNATGFTSGSTALIDNKLTNTDPNTDAVVTYTITPTVNGCTSPSFTYVVTVHPTPILTVTNNAAVICSGGQTAILLSATPAGTKFTWTVSGTPGAAGFTAQNTTVAATGISQTLSNTSNAGATVTYIITPVSASGCPGTPVTATITVNPATSAANAGTSATLCNVTTYTLNGNTPAVGTGKWTADKPVTFVDDTNPTTVVNGLVPGTTYQFTWTITSACGTSAPSTITVVDNAASVGGTATAAVNPVCYGSNGTITLSGQTGNVTAWQRSTDGGANWVTIAGTNTGTTYNYTNLTQNTSFRAIVVSGNCSIANSAPVAIGVSPLTTIPDAGPDQLLCNQSVTTLRSGNNAVAGQWSGDPSNAPGAVITSPTSLTTTVTGLKGGNTYRFIWTVTGAAPCSNLPDDMTVTNLVAIANNTVSVSNNTTIVCAGSAVTFNGGTPTGGNGSFAYVWESSTDNGITWAAIPQTTQSITIGVGQKTAFRRTVNSGSCSDISTPITIDISAPVSNNTLPISAQTCYNTIPGLITGSQPNGGDGVNFIYQWQQSSSANTGFTDINGATGKDYQPALALTADVYYRRVVSTAFCNGATGNISQPIHIIVTPDVVAKFTAATTVNCSPFNITSSNISTTADANAGSYTWFAVSAGGATATIGTGLTFPGYTIPTDGTTVTIKLVVTSAAGCKDASMSMDFSTIKNTSFTAVNVSGSNCGPLTYKFTNTTGSTINTTYKWDFGDGTTYTGITPPNHTFQPDATGNDASYTITLTAGNCSGTVSTQKITVYPAAPKAYIDPGASTGCAPYTITVKNITPGTNSSYVFTLYDETNRLVQTITKTNNDKSDAVFAAINTTNTVTYTVKMVTTNLCGTSTQSAIIPIVITSTGISARMAVSPTTNTGIVAGCAPFMASFQNLSTGGNSYVYNIYDANFNPIKSIPTTGNISYNFDVAGTYYVSIGVFSSCTGGVESPKTKITVYPVAAPAFAATTATTGCTQLTVSFANNTPNISPAAPANSFTYTWDFGDGSPTVQGFTPPPHTYDYKKSPYTVTLSVVNNNGCFSSTNRAGYIVVNPPPQTDFTALPDTITSIPNYTFAFVDKTQNPPASWRWDFGDGTTSNRQNPTHTYADTGRYKVTLTTISQFGCTDSKTHTVQVAGVPGQLYVPNAFMPTSLSQELRVFTVKGSGIKTWSLRIMNNWGQVVFETSKLSTKGEPLEFWDGKYKGQDAPQGVYAWEVTAQFINGTDWRGMSYKGSAPKRSGTLTLIR